MKVRALGIIGRIYDWIEDWLNDREQRVVLLESNSKWTKVMSLYWAHFVSNVYK